MRRSFIMFVVVGAVASCSADRVSSSTEQLTSITQARFSNTTDPMATPPNHFATTSTLTIADSSCGGLGNDFRTTVVWEEEAAGSSDQPIRTFIGNECGFNPLTINGGGSATLLTTAVTGIPPEWTTAHGATPMSWGKEISVVPVVNPQGVPLIALVGEVGPAPSIPGSCGCLYEDIAFALSFDGGQTWGNAHLLPVGLGPPGLDDLAVAVSHHIDESNGVYFSMLNTESLDFFLTWTQNGGQRWFDVASYLCLDAAGRNCVSVPAHWASGTWSVQHTPLTNLDMNSVINPTGLSPSNIFNMSIVSGIVKTPADKYPYVVVQWPAVNDPTSSPGWFENCQTGGTSLVSQVWHTAVSYTYGTTWVHMPDSHAVVQPWPTCVGFMPPGQNYRNSARSSLAFNFATGTVEDAVAMPDSIDPIPGTYIESNAFDMSACCTPPAMTTPIFNTTHSAAQPYEDQFLPALASDWTAPELSLVYADSIDDPTQQNVPSGLYGVTTQTFSVPIPGWSAASQTWPVPPAPPGLLGVPPMQGLVDVLGRHNSISVNGWSWLTFAGDWTQAYPPPNPPLFYSSMDTVSIQP